MFSAQTQLVALAYVTRYTTGKVMVMAGVFGTTLLVSR
jgi:hypothetical protein